MVAPATISCRDGWFPEEHDGVRPFRWMSREARCGVSGVPAGGRAWLRVTAGHAWPRESWPVVSVFVNGPLAGRCTIRADFSDYLFPLPQAGDADVRLSLDRTSTPPGEARELGVMVRSIDVVDLETADAPIHADGWYAWQDEAYFPYRWMGREARLLVPASLRRRGRFAAVPMYSVVEDRRQTLTLRHGNDAVLHMPLLYGWHVYDLVLAELGGDADSPLDLSFAVDALLPAGAHPSDPRDLGVGVGVLDVHDDAKRHRIFRVFYEAACRMEEYPEAAAGDSDGKPDAWLAGGEGWYDWELEDRTAFRWMRREARIAAPENVRRDCRFLGVRIRSEFDDLSQVLTILANDETIAEAPLLVGWNDYSFALPDRLAGPAKLVFRLNKVIPASGARKDRRELGAAIGRLTFHDDEERHAHVRFCHENALLNQRELHEGGTILSSFPVNLGIDLFGKCNIKPPCVYCLWDRSKAAEGADVDAVVDDRTLEAYGNFFHAARVLANCSFGEPMLHPRLAEILEFFERHRKRSEMSSNGQAFTPAVVEALAGRNVVLFVSLDAASPATYARLRNDRWHEVITGLTFLREARRKAHGLPHLNMVFMPMRANLGDLEAFFKLCVMAGASTAVLRPLNYLENARIYADRGGYHFDYDHELLTTEELEAVFERSERYATQYGMPLVSQFDFEGARRRKGEKGRKR